MFEDALRQAPREELVEHIRLQRELIHRLHRRVLELEDSLERVCGGVRPTNKKSPDDAACLVSSSSLKPENGTGLPPVVDTHTPRGTGPSPLVGLGLPATLAPPPPLHRAGATAGSHHGDGLRAPEPRREIPQPHGEERVPTISTASPAVALPSASDTLGGQLTTSATSVANATSTPAGPLSSSNEHPTLLEGIKEINYVLAAHRAGRPALPLPVAEELEEIRTRLLRDFKQAYFLGGDDDTSDDTALPLHTGGAPEHMAPSQPSLRGRLEFSVDADGGAGRTPPHSQAAHGRGASVAGHVCPRWVSPESSRVVYGTSPHRRW